MHLKADKRKLTIRRPYYNPLAILFGIPTIASTFQVCDTNIQWRLK